MELRWDTHCRISVPNGFVECRYYAKYGPETDGIDFESGIQETDDDYSVVVVPENLTEEEITALTRHVPDRLYDHENWC